MVYAVIGIYEYYENTGDEEARRLFEKGVQSLKQNLARYDAGWWTCYDNLGLVATKTYHAVHLDLMKRLYEITFLEMHNKWSKYKQSFSYENLLSRNQAIMIL